MTAKQYSILQDLFHESLVRQTKAERRVSASVGRDEGRIYGHTIWA